MLPASLPEKNIKSFGKNILFGWFVLRFHRPLGKASNCVTIVIQIMRLSGFLNSGNVILIVLFGSLLKNCTKECTICTHLVKLTSTDCHARFLEACHQMVFCVFWSDLVEMDLVQ